MKRLFNRKANDKPETLGDSGDRGPPPSPSPPTSRPGPAVDARPAPGPPVEQPYTLPPPPRVTNVGNAIGWSVAMPTFDFPYLLSLADYLGSSSTASKEAAKALRTEFKHGTPIAQERAVRLTGILVRNTDHRFREQVASKKFLGDVTDLVGSKKTDPNVKEMVYRVLSPLAHDYQHDADLRAITQTFNKLLSTSSTSLTSFPNSLDPLSPSFQLNGAPLDPDDPLFTPTGLLPSSNSSRRHHRSDGTASLRNGGRGGGGSGRRFLPDEPIPAELEKDSMRELGERADKAKGLARLLSEAIVFSREEGLEGNEMIEEFQMQCLEEQEFLSQNLEWASVQAEKSRTETVGSGRDEASVGTVAPEAASAATTTTTTATNLASNNPFADVVKGETARPASDSERKTEEEEILAKMFAAHSDIQDALQLLSKRLSTARHDAQHEKDLERATELSKTQVRGTGAAGLPNMHERGWSRDYGEGGSGSGTTSTPALRPGSRAADEEDDGHSVIEERERRQDEENRRNNPYAEFMTNSNGYDGSAPALAPPVSHGDMGSTTASPTTTTTATRSPYDDLAALEGLDFGAPSTTTAASESFSAPPVEDRPRQSFPSSNPYSTLSLSTSGFPVDQQQHATPITDSPVSSSFLPPQPSEKALGKLRRVSLNGNERETDEERQAVLEAQLREKYQRNLAERDQDAGGIREV